MAKKATIQDVALAANVSIATVSRVLNNPKAVKGATRMRVQQAFDKVGYAVDPAIIASDEDDEAEVAKERKPENIILTIVPDLRNPFYAEVLDGIISRADYNGYELILSRAKMSRYSLKQLKRLVDKTNACGVLLLGKIASAEDLEALEQYLPVVQCTEFEKNCDLPYVSIDDYGAARSVMDLLLEKGRRRIALLNGPTQFKYAVERERGYNDALAQAGIPVEAGFVIHQSISEFELALSNASRLFARPDRPDAIFAVSDVLAVAAVRAARRAGLRIPEDVAIVGFDDTFLSQMCEPPLTTVRQRSSQMGAYACDTLLDLVKGRQLTSRQILMDVDLLVREST